MAPRPPFLHGCPVLGVTGHLQYGTDASDRVRPLVGDGVRFESACAVIRTAGRGRPEWDGRRAPRPCSGRPASRLHSSQTPPVDGNLRREIQSGWPRRSSPWGTWRLLGRSRRAHVWRRFVPIISFDDALVLYALLTLFGRHGEAAWRGQDDTGRTRAAFRAGGRQVAFRHRSQLCERPALLAHIFVRWHRPPTSGERILRQTSPTRLWKPYQLTAGL